MKNSIKELSKTLLIAGSIAIFFRSIFFEPFNIPSGSMIPTLLVGDYLFVSKYSYGYSKYSFPFGLVPIKDRVLYNTPQRGDVIVFRNQEMKQLIILKGWLLFLMTQYKLKKVFSTLIQKKLKELRQI